MLINSLISLPAFMIQVESLSLIKASVTLEAIYYSINILLLNSYFKLL